MIKKKFLINFSSKKLDAFLPKIIESYRLLHEKNVIKAKIPLSPVKDEVSSLVKNFMNEYFNLSKSSLDLSLLKKLKEERQKELSLLKETQLSNVNMTSFSESNKSQLNDQFNNHNNLVKKNLDFSSSK